VLCWWIVHRLLSLNQRHLGLWYQSLRILNYFTKVPTIAISSDTDKFKTGESTTITFTLSEVSTDFDATDVVVTGGILTDFALKANETKVYTATFTPTANSAT
jgi:hypothetical protein